MDIYLDHTALTTSMGLCKEHVNKAWYFASLFGTCPVIVFRKTWTWKVGLYVFFSEEQVKEGPHCHPETMPTPKIRFIWYDMCLACLALDAATQHMRDKSRVAGCDREQRRTLAAYRNYWSMSFLLFIGGHSMMYVRRSCSCSRNDNLNLRIFGFSQPTFCFKTSDTKTSCETFFEGTIMRWTWFLPTRSKTVRKTTPAQVHWMRTGGRFGTWDLGWLGMGCVCVSFLFSFFLWFLWCAVVFVCSCVTHFVLSW